MGLKGYVKRWSLAGVAAATLGVSVVAAVPATSGAATRASSSGGTATMALDENLAGFNINTSAANEFVLQEILNMVWPQAVHREHQAPAGPEHPPARPSVTVTTNPADHHLQDQPQGGVAGRHAHHGRRLHLQLAGPERQPRLHRRRRAALRRRVDVRLQPDRLGDRLEPAQRRRLRPRARRPTATPACARTATRSRSSSSPPSPTGRACSATSSRRTSPARSAGTPASAARPRPSRAAGTRSRATTTTSRWSWSATPSTGAPRAS